MAPNNNRRNKKKWSNNQNRNLFHLLQRIQRMYSCWNCHRFGHNRHQCLLPRTISCSFCRKPGVQTVDCRCQGHINLAQRHNSYRTYQGAKLLNTAEAYNPNVLVPNTSQPHSYIQRQNLVVSVPNDERIEGEMETSQDEEEEEDILEIHPESDCLDEI